MGLGRSNIQADGKCKKRKAIRGERHKNEQPKKPPRPQCLLSMFAQTVHSTDDRFVRRFENIRSKATVGVECRSVDSIWLSARQKTPHLADHSATST